MTFRSGQFEFKLDEDLQHLLRNYYSNMRIFPEIWSALVDHGGKK